MKRLITSAFALLLVASFITACEKKTGVEAPSATASEATVTETSIVPQTKLAGAAAKS